MPQQKLVFVGREIQVNREDFHDIRPSVEQDDDEAAARESDDELVRSDLQAYDSDGDEDKNEDEDNDGNEEVEPEDLSGLYTKSPPRPQKSTSSSSRPKRELRPRQTGTPKQVPQGAIRKTRPTAAKTRLKQKKITRAGKPAASGGKDQEWEVEKIVSSLIEEGTLKHFYEVKWKGFSSQHNTWEPKVNLRSCQALVDAYENKSKRTK